MNREHPEDFYPLSPMQQGMLFHSLYAPQSGMYVQQLICGLHEDLQVAAFERAWRRVVALHTALRTRFRWDGSTEPCQEVQREVSLPWDYHDWRGASTGQQDNRLEAFLEADRRRGFVLSEAPLMRLALFRMSEGHYQLVWTSHHALLDGRSRLVLLKELFALYEAFCRGRDLQLQPPRPNRDYIDLIRQQDLRAAESFWRSRLGGFPAPTPLGVDRVRDTQPGEEEGYGKQSVQLSETLTSALRSLAHHHLTPNTLLQGAWALLLNRYSGEEEVVFGATRAWDRSTLDGAESMVGLFINTLPMRVRVSPEGLLLPWLKELRAQWKALQSYEHTPLVTVQGWSDIPPGEPLFGSLVVFENYLLDSALRAQGGSWENRDFRLLGPTNYPLTVTGYLAPKFLLEIAYERRRFNDATITRMLGHLQMLLQAMVADPEQRLADLSLVTDQERRQLLVEWNDTAADYPQCQCIHQLFEAQVEQTPEAIAVVFAHEQVTYGELNRRANQLAHHLRALGVGPEVLVGLCVERSPEMVVGLLGILKAGGAYVPLDPAYPRERLAFMLKDTQVPVLLTQGRLLEGLPEDRPRVVCLDTDWKAISLEGEENLITAVTAENLAYVTYTSGSTGTPKGVAIPHRGVARLLFGVDYVHLDATETFLQLAPISFDASTFEVWGALLHGARLALFPERVLTSKDLSRLIKQQGVSTLWLTASLFNAVIDEAPEALSGVRQLITGGEALSVAHVQRALALLPATQIINGYGPTESTTFACCFHIPKRLDKTVSSIPLGRPIANTEVYLLDSSLCPVPVGVPGELYIGGAGLARGYLNRPELTAEKFIPNPFSVEPGARLYKTGDLARYRPDGNIEFLGRIDHQVKIRGFRIELGEVEAVLGRCPAVQDSVVLAREDVPGEKRLVAYVVPEQEQIPTVSELYGFLQANLPAYMVPSAFVLLDALPLMPSGKVDRRALPAPEQVRPELGEAFKAPRTPVEEVLAGIWADVLGLEQVGIHDNFFELGGHSLLAMQIISRVCRTFKVELPLRALFATPTVAGLADGLETTGRAKQGLQTPPILPVCRGGPLPLSFAQERLWFLAQLEPESSAYHIPAGFRLRGALDVSALERSLNEIVRRHEALRTTLASVDGSPVQIIAENRTLPLPALDLSASPEPEREAAVRHLLTAEAQRPFNLAHDLLLRATLLRLGEQEHVLLLVMHHITSDAWSLGIFLRELAVLYGTFSAGQPSPLPALSVQYADYALWQRQQLQGVALDHHLTYWRRQLSGLHRVEMPTDRPRSAVQTPRGARHSVVLSQRLTAALHALSRREGATLFMTLLAALQILLHRYTGEDDIAVGAPIAGRTQVETEGLIGFFVNTLVLRTDLSGEPSFRQLLRRVREVTLGAYAHQDVPFEKLVENSTPNGISAATLCSISCST